MMRGFVWEGGWARVLVLAACLAGGTARAAPSFRVDKNYPEVGLRFRTLGNSVPEPLAQPKTHTYTFTRGEEQTKRDLFDPSELWYASQHAGQWRDADGNVLILGRPTRLRPAFDQKHVSREAFDASLAAPETAFDPESAASLAAWVGAFASCTPRAPEPLRTGFNLTHALFFPVEESATLVYAFRAKRRQANGRSDPSEWFCAVVKIGDGTFTSKVRKDFETQFLANVAALPQVAGAAQAAGPSKALLPPVAADEIPDHPSRAAARKSIANMRGWWYAETMEYIFLSDIRSATGKGLVRELQETLPALRRAFATLIPPFDEKTDVSVVRIFEEQEAYRQYVGNKLEWSAGLWSPMRRELVILSQGRDREQTLEIIRHEAFHQYLFYASAMIENAVWFNEGHACFFEGAEVDAKGRVEIPENRRVAHLLREFDAVTAQIPVTLKADYAAFYNGAERLRQLNYTTAWALVYFLRKGAPSERLTAYAGILGAYLKALAETKDDAAATAAAFEGIDMPRFQKDFADFWRKGRNSGRRYDPLAAAAPADAR